MDHFHLEGDTRLGVGPLAFRSRWGISAAVDNPGEGFPLGGKWGYADDRVRMVKGYDLRFARNFYLLNTDYDLFDFLFLSVSLSADFARYNDVVTNQSHTLFGYGAGLRFWFPASIRIQYGAPKEGIGDGSWYAGFGWEF